MSVKSIEIINLVPKFNKDRKKSLERSDGCYTSEFNFYDPIVREGGLRGEEG